MRLLETKTDHTYIFSLKFVGGLTAVLHVHGATSRDEARALASCILPNSSYEVTDGDCTEAQIAPFHAYIGERACGCEKGVTPRKHECALVPMSLPFIIAIENKGNKTSVLIQVRDPFLILERMEVLSLSHLLLEAGVALPEEERASCSDFNASEKLLLSEKIQFLFLGASIQYPAFLLLTFLTVELSADELLELEYCCSQFARDILNATATGFYAHNLIWDGVIHLTRTFDCEGEVLCGTPPSGTETMRFWWRLVGFYGEPKEQAYLCQECLKRWKTTDLTG